jgi:3-phosphoshikimate 1-carboxyvinyltransferase
MEPIFEPLSRLGVNCRSINNDGKLPVVVEGGGIKGGTCEIDGTISSQFVSSLLISCVRAESDTIVSIKDPDNQVSKPYIESTLRVMASFGFRIKVERSRDHGFRLFEIPSNQIVEGKEFRVPGDFSSAAALIGVTLAAEGTIRISNAGFKGFSQSDSKILPIARQFGAKIRSKNNILFIKGSNKRLSKPVTLDLKDAPDLVPIIAGLAAATGRQVSIENIGHLRFKESDRIGVLSKELSKIGVPTRETESTLSLMGSVAADSSKVVKIDPSNDHRILMALTIAGLSGRFGALLIQDPDCVRKSYPSFVSDIQKLCHEKSTVRILSLREGTR